MRERPNPGFAERAEALEKRLDETSDFVQKRWHTVEGEMEARKLEAEQRADARGRKARRTAGVAMLLTAIATVLSAVLFVTSDSLGSTGLSALVAITAALALFETTWLRRSATAASPVGVSTRSAPLVLALDEIDKPVPDRLLPDLVARSAEAVDVLVADAKAQGLVENRGEGVVLTPAGRAAGEQLRAYAEKAVAEAAEPVDERESDPDPEAEPPAAAGV